MDCNYYRITNYNNVQEGYYSWTGCTNIVSVSQIDPLQTQYICGDGVFVENYGAPLTVVFVGLCPSTTPTPTQTPTVTPTTITQTPTPTSTVTPTVTPTTVYVYNLRTGGWYQDVCNSVNMIANPANVTVYASKPFDQLEIGDNVYGDSSLTIPPNSKGTISNGGKFIQLNGTLIINMGVC